MEPLIRRLIGEDIDFKVKINPQLGRIKADAGQIEQVVMNLAINARDAMPDGGTLVIETSNAKISEANPHQPHVAPGPYVALSVSDSGVGIDKATQEHIFEPFFTTKPRGKGTGLGLATVQGIVRQTGGHISVESEVGRGTTFKILLPATDEPLAEPIPIDSPLRVMGSETILLVEDQPMLRELMEVILEQQGYKVIVAETPEHGLERANSYDGTIHVLLTDVIMPGMNGRALAEQVRRLRPDVRVLFMSGYTDDVVLQRGGFEPGMGFLAKPFSPETLGRKVREILNHPMEQPSRKRRRS